jgi:hypothetical protein
LFFSSIDDKEEDGGEEFVGMLSFSMVLLLLLL